MKNWRLLLLVVCLFFMPVFVYAKEDSFKIDWINENDLDYRENYDFLRFPDGIGFYNEEYIKKFNYDGIMIDNKMFDSYLYYRGKKNNNYYFTYYNGLSSISGINGNVYPCEYGVTTINNKEGLLEFNNLDSYIGSNILINDDSSRFIYYYSNEINNTTEVRYGYYEDYSFKSKLLRTIEGIYRIEKYDAYNYDGRYQYIMVAHDYSVGRSNLFLIEIDDSFNITNFYTHDYQEHFSISGYSKTGKLYLYRVGDGFYVLQNSSLYCSHGCYSQKLLEELFVLDFNNDKYSFYSHSDMYWSGVPIDQVLMYSFNTVTLYNDELYFVVDHTLYKVTESGFENVVVLDTEEVALEYFDYAPYFYNYYFGKDEYSTLKKFDGFNGYGIYNFDDMDVENKYKFDYERCRTFLCKNEKIIVYDIKNDDKLFEVNVPYKRNSVYVSPLYTIVDDSYLVVFSKVPDDMMIYAFDFDGEMIFQRNLKSYLDDSYKDDDITSTFLFNVDNGFVVGYGRAFQSEIEPSSLINTVSDDYDYVLYDLSFAKFSHFFSIDILVAKGRGEVVSTKNSANNGDDVEFTIKPYEGYELECIRVLDSKGNIIEFDDYAFSMPSDDVVIEVSFRKINNPLTSSTSKVIALTVAILLFSVLLVRMRKV